ncbi:hypothetical protein [Tanticharoenia sakaeratensis]|uniref:Uncharacterized protein n=1 Tax=Tanticharoenia sakaeratensis NBRC 103193 TaxID=1231623 RepID=A0A0D6MPP0_9PROT|nr:hypothetical protein [Tanticharoenia sakaeratensis]GAN55238.1 hypothetical protein Tasa_041_033 [Tanticharoenia sakaeratensis NBRC 103193]GBQ23326.1 hypothetical protein AA103193_2376 [Tanticharoenia sakaeratensis NBRC 103193]
MTQRSQDRQHTGKRGAAQRKARREGYAAAAEYRDRFNAPTETALADCVDDAGIFYPKNPRIAGAFRHGAHDWARKHKGLADEVA